MTKKNDHGIEGGQYWAVKVRGTGGDLVLGLVKSVRHTKDKDFIVSENLLTGKVSTKQASVLLQRNKRISKRQADKILKLHRSGATKAEVREAAIAAPEVGARPVSKKQVPLNLSRCRKPGDELREKLQYLADQFIKDVLALVEEGGH